MIGLKKKKTDEPLYGGDAVLFDAEAKKRVKKGLETQTIDLEALEKQKKEISSFYPSAYRLLADKVKFLFPRLINLEKQLRMGGLMVQYEAYVCGLVLASIIAGIVGLVAGLVIVLLFNIDPPALEMIFPIITGVGASQGTFGIMMILPKLHIKTRAGHLTEELPYFLGYMATLASSGLGLEAVFKAIAKDDSKKPEEIVKDSRYMVRNLEMLGMDIITALKDLIQRTPPGPYNELLEGLIATVETGGSLGNYFVATAKVQLQEKKLMLQKATASLGIIAEMYTILMIVFPLLSAIMLSIMAIMTPNLGGFPLTTLMKGLAYVMVPVFGTMMLFMIDSMTPKR